MKLITGDEVRSLLPMRECIERMEALYLNEGERIQTQPMRTVTQVDDHSVFLTMPSYSSSLARFAVKIVSEFQDNPRAFSLPRQGGVIVLIDTKNAQVLALLDAPSVTATRTGAVGGLAARLLSREDSSAVAVVGSGQQARTQLEAVCCVRKIATVRVFSPNQVHARLFADEMSEKLGISMETAADARHVTEDADVVILATNSRAPVLTWEDVPEGCHVTSIGTLPDRREVDETTIANSLLFVDFREGVLSEAGDVIQAIRSGAIEPTHIRGDLGELLRDPAIGRRKRNDVTFFKSVGFGLQDVYATSCIYDKIA